MIFKQEYDIATLMVARKKKSSINPRAEAAKKGWETRRKNEATAKRKASRAAKKK